MEEVTLSAPADMEEAMVLAPADTEGATEVAPEAMAVVMVDKWFTTVVCA